ncbi:hypothetical protein T484DRAFT_1805812 [Baffinella frigidus]|nr:hypothetical protein T484DRAFT_1805812 [Cryptophyta sp. CCMP2293]
MAGNGNGAMEALAAQQRHAAPPAPGAVQPAIARNENGAGATGASEVQHGVGDGGGELQALLVQWGLGSSAAVFAELGVEKTTDLEWLLDSDVEELNIPKVAKRKVQAMLSFTHRNVTLGTGLLPFQAMLGKWRADAAESHAQKKAKLEAASVETGDEKAAAPAEVKKAEAKAAGGEDAGGGPKGGRVAPEGGGFYWPPQGGAVSGVSKGGEGKAALPGEVAKAEVKAAGAKRLDDAGGGTKGGKGTAPAEAEKAVASGSRRAARAGARPAASPSARRPADRGPAGGVSRLAAIGGGQRGAAGAGAGGGGGITPSTKLCRGFSISVRGGDGNLLAFMVTPSDTVAMLKKMIKERGGIPSERQMLIFGGAQLADGRTMEDENIVRSSTLYLVSRLGGN